MMLRLLTSMPLWLSHGIAVVLGSLLYWIPNREAAVAETNLGLCFPNWSELERRKLLRRTLVENLKTLLEAPAVWAADPKRLLAVTEDPEQGRRARELLDRRRGLIIAAPHLGSWEVGIHYLATLGPITALYRPPKEGSLTGAMLEGRGRGGAKLAPTTMSGIKALYSALAAGEIVTILPDQQPPEKGAHAGVFAPFFGVPALTMVLLGRLARKTGAPVIFSYAERLSRNRGFRILWVEAAAEISDSDPKVAAAALNRGVEECVRRCPAQYQWTYKRFKARPEGFSDVYRKKKGQTLSGL